MTVTAAGAWNAGSTFAIFAAFAIGAFAVYIGATLILYHLFHLLSKFDGIKPL